MSLSMISLATFLQSRLLIELDMLRVTIELWPAGFRSEARTIAVADISNTSDLADVSDYW